MKRHILDKLVNWIGKENRKPLILNGARQVGKTWLMQELGQRRFAKTAYINLDSNRRMKQTFETDFDIPRILRDLKIESRTDITPHDTLIILDEIQANPAALTCLKYFCENAPEYPVIVAGSLLGVSTHYGSGFPVGKVETLDVHPLTFTEFLDALGEAELRACILEGDWRSITIFHKRLADLLRNYYFVGGMPAVVAEFQSSQNYEHARATQCQILQDYNRDFSKHIPKEILARVRLIWDSIPAQLARENKRFFYGAVRKGARAKDLEDALVWLIESRLVYQVKCVSKPALPLAAYALDSFKLYTLDVGLLAAQSNLDARTLLEGDALLSEFKGALTEQFVHQQLLAECALVPYYWKNDKGTAEIDFIFQDGTAIFPLEVKAGENLKSKSLKVYRDLHAPPYCLRTSLANYRKETWLTNIPLYAISQIRTARKKSSEP